MSDHEKEATPVPDGPVTFGLEGGGLAIVIPPYGSDPVRPVSEYCEAFETWLALIEKKVADNPPPTEGGWDEYARFRKIAEVAHDLRLSIRKSNYLWRRIYKGEPHRTEPCPVHKGRWSGCSFSDPLCVCASDVNITGWLPSTSGVVGR